MRSWPCHAGFSDAGIWSDVACLHGCQPSHACPTLCLYKSLARDLDVSPWLFRDSKSALTLVFLSSDDFSAWRLSLFPERSHNILGMGWTLSWVLDAGTFSCPSYLAGDLSAVASASAWSSLCVVTSSRFPFLSVIPFLEQVTQNYGRETPHNIFFQALASTELEKNSNPLWKKKEQCPWQINHRIIANAHHIPLAGRVIGRQCPYRFFKCDVSMWYIYTS